MAAEELPAVEVPATVEAIVATALQSARGVTADSDVSLRSIIEKASEDLGSIGARPLAEEQRQAIREAYFDTLLADWGLNKGRTSSPWARVTIPNQGNCCPESMAFVYRLGQAQHGAVREAAVMRNFQYRDTFLKDQGITTKELMYNFLNAELVLPSDFMDHFPNTGERDVLYTYVKYLEGALLEGQWLGLQELGAMAKITGIPIILFKETQPASQPASLGWLVVVLNTAIQWMTQCSPNHMWPSSSMTLGITLTPSSMPMDRPPLRLRGCEVR